MEQRTDSKFEEKDRRRHYKINFSYPRTTEYDQDLLFNNTGDNAPKLFQLDETDIWPSEASAYHEYHYGTPEIELWDSLWATGGDRTIMESPGPRFSSLLSVSKWPVPPNARGMHGNPEILRTRLTTTNHADQNYIESMQAPVGMIGPQLVPSSFPQEPHYQPRGKRKSFVNMFPRPPAQFNDMSESNHKAKGPKLRKKPPHLTSVPGPRVSTSTSSFREWLHHRHSPLRNISIALSEPKSAPPQMEHFSSAFDSDSDTEDGKRRKSKSRRRHSLHHKRSFKASDVERMVLSVNAKENGSSQQSNSSNGIKEGPFRRTWSRFIPKVFTSKSQRS
ncbi:hypothetical protein PFICI_02264 [Pestalotiopsis fici W106-1]|uniref:Uncharacterized protein n=1 Tax=Pestalotiopsis fici (strain W106-1 / CGMCC3.15140) TaxID=1229662 RepID=W3XE12_PESFW|nr:uncharacterized protein PFICI_02264 [Pestalotiopsis fici W106-1]ETS84239.1 hypothetical protein PFICI_02264 [Pestalotiopsis fici W106-1]